ncbi:MAG: hypothetical protein ACE5G0_08410 [Rhodothermales bacterium]
MIPSMRVIQGLKTGLCLCLLAGMLFATSSCDDPFIDPFENNDRYFTVFGFLHERETEHTVRVIPVTRHPERIASPTDPQATLDATVTSIDLGTGERHTWQHTLERLDNGNYGHIFRTHFIVQRGHTYRLEVRRSDGVTAAAETTVPNLSAIVPEFGPFHVSADTTVVTQDVVLPGIASPWNIEVLYRLRPAVRIPYERTGERTDDGGWRFTLDLTNDRGFLSSLFGIPSPQVLWEAMGLQIEVLDDQWDPPDGVFDPEVLAQPGRLSNVENGYGFWGSVGLFQLDWPISCEMRDIMGFPPPDDVNNTPPCS